MSYISDHARDFLRNYYKAAAYFLSFLLNLCFYSILSEYFFKIDHSSPAEYLSSGFVFKSNPK